MIVSGVGVVWSLASRLYAGSSRIALAQLRANRRGSVRHTGTLLVPEMLEPEP